MIRAKFKYTGNEASLSHHPKKDAEGKQVIERGRPIYEEVELRMLKFQPVYGNGDPNHENTKFFNATACGEIKIGTVNPEVWQQLELGAEYYVDFTPAK